MPAPGNTDVEDVLFSFEAGQDSDKSILLLPKNQASSLINTTVRGGFLRDRPKYRKIVLDFDSDAALQSAFEENLWQGGTYYKPDLSLESLVVAIAGRLFNVVPDPVNATATVTEETIPGDPNPATRPLAWLWQAENYVIWNDGLSNPVFFDGTSSVRSNYFSTSRSLGPLSLDLLVTAAESIGNPVTANLVDSPIGQVAIGDLVYVPSDSFVTAGFRLIIKVTAVGANSVTGTNTNLFADATHQTNYQAGIPVSYSRPSATQLPPGRMGTYAESRVWMVLTDGKQFIGGDIVGGSSGTAANGFRDSILNITENNYLAGGGFFTIPGSIGDIRFIKPVATLDRSMGQGSVQVGTPNAVFSLNTPTDRLTWQDLTSPLLPQSMIGFGGLGQNSTVNCNSDLYFRSIDGVRSLQIARKDFALPGNTPQSIEVQPILEQDDLSLSEYGSAMVFDNRLHYAVHPTPSDQGVFHLGTVVMQLDSLSSLGKKSNACWEGLYTGLNVLQYMRGQFSGKERAFAFVYSEAEQKIQLWELLKDQEAFADDGSVPVVWTSESSAVLANVPGKTVFETAQLADGEISIDGLIGTANFRIQYRPDSYPCWIDWTSFSVCAALVPTLDDKPGYRTRLGFGEPSPVPCEETNNRPFRNGNYFQIRVTVQGHCIIKMMRFRGVKVPMTRWALPAGCCPGETLL